MSPSKLDARQRARDFRVDPDQTREARHRGGRKKLHHVFKDLTTVTYLQNRDTEDSRYIVLDELPEMTEDWIEKMVVVRSPVGGAPDRMYLGVELSDDSLAWIEISLMAPAPPSTGGGGATGGPTVTWVSHIGVGSLQAGTSYSSGIGTDASGNIWTSNAEVSSGNNVLRKFSPAGAVLVSIDIGLGGGSVWPHPYGIAVHQGSGDVWGADLFQGRVHHYNTSGVNQTAWTPSGVVQPRGVAFNAAASLIFVTDVDSANHRVRSYNYPALTLNTTFGATDLASPSAVAVNSVGEIFVTDTTPHHVVIKYSAGYAKLDTWGTLGATGTGDKEFNYPTSICVDSSDRVYVADRANHRVQLFKSDGTFLTAFGGVGSGNGQFRYPTGVSVSGSTVYVRDEGNGRISAWTVS